MCSQTLTQAGLLPVLEVRCGAVTSNQPYGVNSMAGTLQRVGLRSPGAIRRADHQRWHYAKPIDADALADQYSSFADILSAHGTEIVWFDDDDDDDLADSIFTYDPSFVIPAGAIVLRPGKALRAGEADLHAAFYASNGIPIIGTIEAPGTVEGGDMFWLDHSTIAIGRTFRTNQSGIDQLTDILSPHGVELAVYDLPYHQGPDACLHLMSVVSTLDHDLALVHLPLLPAALYDRMVEMGYTLLAAPPEEFDASLGLNLNVLATGPRRVIAVDGFPGTVALMREADCDVTVFAADELCIPCEGGPTCMTRPLLRN